MQCKAFKFARLATSQFATRLDELNLFLKEVDVVGVPQPTASDEDGTVLFVFYNEKVSSLAQNNNQSSPKAKNESK